MSQIKRVAVLGSGVMGAGIAALVASQVPVTLFDLPSSSSKDRNQIAKDAIANISKSKMCLCPSHVQNIRAANYEDDLNLLAEADWIIEVVVENLDIKHKIYDMISPYIKDNTVLSSNTSTLPVASLTKKMSIDLRKRFVLTHFFNPPKFLDLLEIVALPETQPQYINTVVNFLDSKLGRVNVMCKDTPGFIANRIGCYF